MGKDDSKKELTVVIMNNEHTLIGVGLLTANACLGDVAIFPELVSAYDAPGKYTGARERIDRVYITLENVSYWYTLSLSKKSK